MPQEDLETVSEERMEYYAAWPRWSVPKWVGVTLGGVFTLIVIVCAGMIVHLLRPPKRVPLPIVATAVVQPKTAATVATSAMAPVAQSAPVAAPASAPATAVGRPAAVAAHAAKKHSEHAHKHAILAKHDGKAGRSAKTDLDRLLGL
jgi:hypothetical protein